MKYLIFQFIFLCFSFESISQCIEYFDDAKHSDSEATIHFSLDPDNPYHYLIQFVKINDEIRTNFSLTSSYPTIDYPLKKNDKLVLEASTGIKKSFNFISKKMKVSFRKKLGHLNQLDIDLQDIKWISENKIIRFQIVLMSEGRSFSNSIENQDQKEFQNLTKCFYDLFKVNPKSILDKNKQTNNLNSSKKADEYSMQGYRKYENGDYYGAISDYSTALIYNSNDEGHYRGRGLAKVSIKDYEGAIKDFDAAIEIHPNFVNDYLNIGFCYNQLGNYIKSIDACNAALKIDPKHAKAYYYRALVQFELDKKEKACSDLDKAIELGYKDAINEKNKYCNKSTYDYGDAATEKYRSGDYFGALQDWNRHIEANPNNGFIYFNRAKTKAALKDNRGAIKDFDTALSLIPTNHNTLYDVYYSRGHCKALLENYDGAINDFSMSIYHNSSFAEAYHYRGLAKLQNSQKESACLDLSKAGELGNRDAYKFITDYCN